MAGYSSVVFDVLLWWSRVAGGGFLTAWSPAWVPDLGSHLQPLSFSYWDGCADIEMCGLRSWVLLGAAHGPVLVDPSLSAFDSWLALL